MGCTPSIHVTQKGVTMKSRSSEENVSGYSEVGTLTSSLVHCAGGEPQLSSYITHVSEKAIRKSPRRGCSFDRNEETPFESKDKPSSKNLSKSPEKEIESNNKELEDPTQLKDEKTILFGPMRLTKPNIKTLLVFPKSEAAEPFKTVAVRLGHLPTVVTQCERALDTFLAKRPHLTLIDARSPKLLDACALCRSMRTAQDNSFTCIVAYIKKSFLEKDEFTVVSFLKAGFNKVLVEGCHPFSEMVQLEQGEVMSMLRHQAGQALFTALDRCKDPVIVTDHKHNIQFMNKPGMKLLGSAGEELLGQNLTDLYKGDTFKSDILESIDAQVRKGKEWEGNLFLKKKTGENLALWSKVTPVNIINGEPQHLVYVKEASYFSERHFSADAGEIFPLGNLKSLRKASCDVASVCSEEPSHKQPEPNAELKNYFGMNRRQSFARFHAMTIEAPITKVINMLLDTQENCPLFVARSLDKALEILRSAELYSPQLGQQPSKPDNQITSDLVSGLITASNKPVNRRLSHEASFKGLPPPSHPAPLPCLSTASPNIKALLEHQNEWGFEIFQIEKFTDKRPLVWLGLSLFSQFGVCHTLGCDEITLKNWLVLIESHYHITNPYHNSTHAADVLQATAYFLQQPRLKAILDPLDEAVCLIAAAVHDVDHPGKNSAFLCNSKNELAILYNDVSVLESHHAALAFRLTTMSGDRVNILKNLTPEAYRAVRLSIIDMVLATEMTKHFEHLSKFVNVFDKSMAVQDTLPEEGIEDASSMSTPENIVLVKRMLIKCADVSNPARPRDLCVEWAYRIATEYCMQTDEEKALGLPVVMPAFDRATCNIPKSQIGFIDFFVNDMFDAWDAFGDFPEVQEHLRLNYLYWKEQEQEFIKQNKTSSLTSPT